MDLLSTILINSKPTHNHLISGVVQGDPLANEKKKHLKENNNKSRVAPVSCTVIKSNTFM